MCSSAAVAAAAEPESSSVRSDVSATITVPSIKTAFDQHMVDDDEITVEPPSPSPSPSPSPPQQQQDSLADITDDNSQMTSGAQSEHQSADTDAKYASGFHFPRNIAALSAGKRPAGMNAVS